MGITIAHIINPFKAKEDSEAAIIQPITFESMRRAKEYASDKVDVELYTAQFEEDRAIIPNYFTPTPDLTSSVLDYVNFSDKRKLPLLRDILDKLHENSDADYFVFTNIDIGLMPQFYVAINAYIEEGLDAFIINRRRVSSRFNSPDQLDEIYSETGLMHNGFDCFVFKREMYEKFYLADVCVGIPNIGNTLAQNLFCWSEHFELFIDKHLTFHVGMELVKNWGDKRFLKHNYLSFRKVLKELYPDMKVQNMPGAGYPFFKRHFKWLMNPNLHYPTMFKLDFKQWNVARKKIRKEDSGQPFYEWLQRKVKLNE